MQEYIVFVSWAFVRFVYSIILAYIKHINQHISILKLFIINFIMLVYICWYRTCIYVVQNFVQ